MIKIDQDPNLITYSIEIEMETKDKNGSEDEYHESDIPSIISLIRNSTFKEISRVSSEIDHDTLLFIDMVFHEIENDYDDYDYIFEDVLKENKYKKNRLRYDIISIIKPMVINYFYSENIIYLRNKIESELPNFYTKWVSQLKFELDNTLHRGIEISNRSFFIGPSDLVDMINDFYDDFNNQNYWRFNKRTGIHINIGRITNGYLSPIKGILFLEDSLVFKDMNNRSKSKFCKSLRSNICNDIKLKSLSLLQDNNINECESLLNDEIYKISSKEYKSFGINFNNKNYVEFRYIGGKVSKNILLDKVEYFINIFNLMSSPILKESLYHKKIYNFLQNRT